MNTSPSKTTSSPSSRVTPLVIHGDVAYLSGQLPRRNGELIFTGRLGVELSVAQGREAARLCGEALLAVITAGTDRSVDRILKLTGFVASSPSFHRQGEVIDAASDTLLAVFGEKGKHARSAIGVAALPHNAPVEIELVVALSPKT